MKRSIPILTVFAVAAALTACSPKSEDQKVTAQAATVTTPAPAAAAAPDMAAMGMSTAAKMASGTGTVTAVDAKAGTVTLDHGPIPALNWPAMTMGFKASPAIIAQVKEGEKVGFDLKMENGSGEITAVRKP